MSSTYGRGQFQNPRRHRGGRARNRGGRRDGNSSRTSSLDHLNQRDNYDHNNRRQRSQQRYTVDGNQNSNEDNYYDCLADNSGNGDTRRGRNRGNQRRGGIIHHPENNSSHQRTGNDQVSNKDENFNRRESTQNQGRDQSRNRRPRNRDPNADDNRTSGSLSGAKRERRMFPMKISQLDKLTKETPSNVILTLVEERSGFVQLINQDTMADGVVTILTKLLSTTMMSKIHKENQNHLMTILLTSKFVTQHLPMFISRNGKKSDFEEEFFRHVGQICCIITQQMPESALEDLQLCVDTCEQSMNMRERLKLPVPLDAKNIINRIQEKFLELTEKQKQIIEQREAMKQTAYFDDDDDIYDGLKDFREVAIIPSIEEIMTDDKPLLRRIITEGRYKNADHYLDVHFRLLREDFIQPLRRGIAEYLGKSGNKKQKIKDIRVYEKVNILEPSFKSGGVSYVIKFNDPSFKKVRWEMSRRLIYGSLVCLSADKFKTTLFATVSDRTLEELKNGKLSVVFEDEFEMHKKLTGDKLEASYTMVESQAYYEAYKHILLGLQNIDAESLPLQNYIINAQRNMESPKYLEYETTYDISCILPNQSTSATMPLRRRLESYAGVANLAIDALYDVEPQPQNLTKCLIQVQNLRTWPSSDELQLDESQRNALHLALSSAMTIIQGPPGTGKTYLGLKIAKVLLNNRHVWRGQNRGPILVVCFTNHALDQFLEGMLSFTKRLVRVGSRSKTEALQRFNIRSIRQRLRINRLQAKNIFYNLEHIKHELRLIRGKWEEIKTRFQLFENKIIHEDSLQILKEFGKEFHTRLLHDFEEHYTQDGIVEQQWRPPSFLFTWLGLDLHGWVHEMEIDNFIDEDIGEFQVVTKGKKRTGEAPKIHQINLNPVNDELKLEDLIDIEDDETAEENRRILDTEIAEDLLPIIDMSQNMVWAFDVEFLHDPSLQIRPEDLQDPALYQMFVLMARARRNIAVRELNKHDFMDEEEVKVEMQSNLWDMSLENRWRFYRLLIKKFIESSETEHEKLRQDFNRIAKRMREVENGEELAIFAENDVIGMTTTGAAKYHEVLQALNPTIVIVEEAAEVLESHIVTSLAPETQHLILIGDHQQLRPKPTVYTLCKDYHLDVSLFERMIKNKVHYETLKIQHRMRPEISRLLVPLIYSSLEDHPSVRKYPPIKGTACSLYFISHTAKEDVLVDTKTHSNQFEAEYLVAFCRYLLQQGYSPDKITILTTYVGQLYAFRNLMKRDMFNGVRVSSVDNFQGEENDIILLSFVRSNDEEKIGFLSIDNRVNVALSRARHGMFCIGNFRLFAKKCELWRSLVAKLECHDFIGDGVEIVCQKHLDDSVRKIVNPVDFKTYAPEGGCLKICGEPLPCQHNCNQVCHLSSHGPCLQRCRKILCGLGHQCPLLCFAECKPCTVKVLKPFLTCEHETRIPCYLDVSKVKCFVNVQRTLPNCQHVVQLACHIDPEKHKCEIEVERELPNCKHLRTMSCYLDPGKVACREPCKWRLDNCGHQCSKTCHPLEDPDHLKIQCQKPCIKLICDREHKCKMLCYQECNQCRIIVKKDLPCGHSAQMECQLSPDLFNCSKKCIRVLPCSHVCPLKCNEKCGGCKELVIKKLPHCSHSVPVSCSEDLEAVACNEKCNRPLPCGHPCQGKCSELCNPKCTYGIQIQADCGHIVEVPCHAKNVLPEIINRYCSYPCNKMLPSCEHMCKGTCGKCRQGRVHIPCNEKCERPLVCGHPCTFPCAQWCPPCKQKCRNKCKHSKCNKTCGNSCAKCSEPCSWQCGHKTCNKYCGMLCDREPCDVPCPKRLRCGHPCIGLCGEPCPPLCRTCNFEELTEFQLYGNETDEDARFVYLPDCKHTIEVEGMDHWMNMRDTETADMSIQMKCCPRCRATVWECPRYGNIIKSTFKDIQSVKRKLFGSNKKQRYEMTRLWKLLQRNYSILEHFKTNYEKLRHKLTGNHNLHQDATAVIENQINILKRMADLKDQFVKKKVCKEARTFADNDFEFLIHRLFLNQERIGDFELTQIVSEIDRIILYVEMLEVEDQWKLSDYQPHAKQNLDKAKAIFAIGNVINVKEADSIKNYLEAAATRKGLGIGETERIMIVKAIDLNPGHWYKCPNGHVYAIGECGGAMEVSKCNECGAQIGGQRHHLLTSNAHAGEMDGSRHAAYSDAANLANYGRNAFN